MDQPRSSAPDPMQAPPPGETLPGQAVREIDALDLRRREILAALAADASTLAAVKASATYRLSRVLRRVIPRAADAAAARGPASGDSASDPPEASAPPADLLQARRQELARLDAEARRVRRELQQALMSRPRRVAVAVRRRLAYVRHPLWVAAALVRVGANRGLLGGGLSAWRRYRSTAELFRFLPVDHLDTDQAHASDAVRWMPPVRISGETHHALFMHPRSSMTVHVRVPGGARVVASCGLLPGVWASNRGGADFEVHVRIPDLDWQSSRSLRIDPAGRFTDRRWRRLVVELPGGGWHDVVVRLSTSVPPGAANAHAWSVWGEPRAEWPRSRVERWRSVVGLFTRFRYAGLLGTLRQIRDMRASDGDAARYRRWMALNTPAPAALAEMAAQVNAWPFRPRISVLTPVYNTKPQWLRACIDSVRRQVYPDWELCLADDGSTSAATRRVLDEYRTDPRIRVVRLPANRGISAATNAALGVATGDFLAMLDHDDELAPEALFDVVQFLARVPDADMVYSDEDKLDSAGLRCEPYFKPDWSPEHFRSTMYTCHLMVLRTSVVRQVGGFRVGYEGSQDYDLVLRLSEHSPRIHHLPKILYHWRKAAGSTAASGLAQTWATDAGERALQDHATRAGFDAVVLPGPAPGLYRMRHRVAGRPLVSIVIPTAGRSREVDGRAVDLVATSVGSIARLSTYDPYEIVIVDDGALPEETLAFLQAVPHRRVHVEGSRPFNFPERVNLGVRESRGRHVVLLNDDVEVIAPEWIEAMLEFSQQDPIGAVGARLTYPDGRLQHVGIVLGVCGLAAHAYHQQPGSTVGYGGSAVIVRNYSAVTAACMMSRREVYERLGGFDEQYGLDFNDIDYCLRLRQAGYRIVYTPYAELCHHESSTAGTRAWSAAHLEAMRRTWADVLDRDPYYSPHLTRDFPDYRIRL
jgi:GT2 family glycosyltransferase